MACKAVVCAINNYGGSPNDLPSCINDARAVAELLRQDFGCAEIRTVFDDEATAANVEAALEWLVKDTGPDDWRVLFYSGHGFTKLVDGVMKEFLVLVDDTGKPALWEDDELVAITQRLPPGVLTAILDCCFSGGLFKWVLDPTDSTAEAAQVKVFQPPMEEQQKALSDLIPSAGSARQRVTGYRQFGCGTSSMLVAKAFGAESSTSWAAPAAASKALADETEAAQPELNGLLISACLETETAAASTSRTKGLSAFTHSMLEVLRRGAERSAHEIFEETATSLKTLGFRQTPMCLESRSGQLASRTFITMKERTMTATETVKPAHAPETTGPVQEQEVQKALFAALAEALPAIIAAVSARQKEVVIEEAPAFGAGGSDQDGEAEADQKIIGMLAATVASTVAQEVLPRALEFAKERISGGRPRKRPAHKALEAAGFDAGGSDQDGEAEADQKIIGMLAATVASTVAQEVLPRALEFAKERISGGRPRKRPAHKAFDVAPAGPDIQEKLLPEIWRLATTAAPQVISMLRQHAAR